MTDEAKAALIRDALGRYQQQLSGVLTVLQPFVDDNHPIDEHTIMEIHVALGDADAAATLVRTCLK